MKYERFYAAAPYEILGWKRLGSVAFFFQTKIFSENFIRNPQHLTPNIRLNEVLSLHGLMLVLFV